MFYVDVHYFNPEGRPFVFNPHATGPFETRAEAEKFVQGLAQQYGFSEGISRAEIRPVREESLTKDKAELRTENSRAKELEQWLNEEKLRKEEEDC